VRFLFGVTGKEAPQELMGNPVVSDIMKNWRPDYNLFSITQISSRTGVKRPRVRRIVNRLIKEGVVKEKCQKTLG